MNKWIVRIPAPRFMCGIHRFATKRAAIAFRAGWLSLERQHSMVVMPPLWKEMPVRQPDIKLDSREDYLQRMNKANERQRQAEACE